MVRRRSTDSLRWWERGVRVVERFRQVPATADLRRFDPIVAAAAHKGSACSQASDDELAARAARLRRLHLADDLALSEFLAVAREVAHRTCSLKPYPVQLLAAASMLRGLVVAMATGEGKTLVGFLVATGHALSGHRVQVLSANDYLAQRDANAGAPFFDAFGLEVSAITDAMRHEERQRGYHCDVVYATVHQVGFDLLRDRQRTSDDERLLPDLDVAVVDEIDAVLIDDAMVPLVLAGDADPQPGEARITELISAMRAGVDYEVDRDRRSVAFTDKGLDLLETRLGIDDLYADDHIGLLTAAHVALHAQAVVDRDVHYVVTDGRVRLINDTRGRVAERQRWPDGLHAAIERKEGLEVTTQAEILDQVLIETVARSYRTLTGMSGTAAEAAERLAEDLALKTGLVDAHRPCIRVDEPDRLYATAEERDAAAADRVQRAHHAGQPVLVGTASVADSERFAHLLAGRGIDAVVLNAKNDAVEAEIIAQAGTVGTVTVSTQMTGRGVDIRLGEGAADAGGLLVVAIGRHDSARLDRQLRGRSGRQGDPGRSVCYTSLEDPIVTHHLILGAEYARPARSIGAEGNIEDSKYAKVYEHAQRVAEGQLLQLHRTTRDYQTPIDRHRQMILDLRGQLLHDDPTLDGFLGRLWPDDPGRVLGWSSPPRRTLARNVALFHLDRAWTRYLNDLAAIREGIHLRVLGRQNPLDEFTIIAAQRFTTLVDEATAATRDSLDDSHDGDSLDDLGLRRPASTWTYMVADNPFGSEADRVVALLGKVLRGGRPPAIGYIH